MTQKRGNRASYCGPERRRPVLIVQHAPHEHPAALRRALESQGIETLWIHSYLGERFPDVSEIGGMISLGGPMGANDEKLHPWIKTEVRLLREAVEGGLPVVGICLGGQMMARALGGRVEKHVSAEVGWYPIEINEAGQEDPILKAAGVRPTVYHWHGDTFHLPPGAELLASSEICDRQAYRYGERAYGFQFHPEADAQLVHEWLAVEGVEDEIFEEQKTHGAESVQDAATQRLRAMEGQEGSIRITAAISNLFRRRHQQPIPGLRERAMELFAAQAECVFEVEGSHRKPLRLRGEITAILNINAGSFAILRERRGVLWPIRIDDTRKLRKATDPNVKGARKVATQKRPPRPRRSTK